MNRHWRWLAVVLAAAIVLPTGLHAAQKKNKSTKAQKADERRENEAVRKARQDVKSAQEAEGAAERAAKKALEELKAAERSQLQAARQLQDLRQELESRHAESTGLIAARKNLDAARRDYEAAGRPVLQRLAETPKYKDAVAAAEAAETTLKRLRAATGGNPEDRRRQLAEAAKIKQVPAELERAALDAESSLQPQRTRLMSAEEAVGAARNAADKAIEKDPALKAASSKVESAGRDLAAARRAAMQEERKLADARQKLARERQDLQQKIAADKRDPNKK